MKRYIIVNKETGIVDGIYYCLGAAKRGREELLDMWQGLTWEIEETTDSFPNGLCTGHKEAARMLKAACDD